MNGLRHPFTGAVYEQDGHGQVLVTVSDGRSGRFRRNGQWISGEVREADPQLCGWVGGPIVGNHRLTASTPAAPAPAAPAPAAPEFGRLLAPLLADLDGARRPAFLARLERTAAARYRMWAETMPQWRDELLGCAAREDEIADRMLAAFPIDDAAAAELDARLPAARDLYYAVFDGMATREQLRVQAAAERQGANAWRSVATSPGLDAAVLGELAACSALEERTADVVDALLSA